jgi:hypothetical protein
MKIIKDIVSKMNDTLEEIDYYASKAHHIRTEHKALADTYIKIAEMHIDIYGMLHDRVIKIIEEQKAKGVQVPHEMMAIWEYEHENLVKEFAKAKFMIEEYKKSNY